MVRPESMATPSGIRGQITKLVEHPKFVGLITALILINAITLGVGTSLSISEDFQSLLGLLDTVILSIFSLELSLRLYAYRLVFFRSAWNIFDLAIITVSWVPSSAPLVILRTLRVFRVLKMLRLLRLFSVLPQMRQMIEAILYCILGMSSVLCLMLFIFYVSAVLVTILFGQHPDPQMQEWFGNIGASAYTLFQIMTLEGWSESIVRPTMALYPLAWLFFVPFIVISSFVILNLFVGIIVDAMANARKREGDEDYQNQQVMIENLQRELVEIKRLLQEKQ